MNGTELFAESTNDDSCARWLNMSLPWCEALAAKFNRMLLFSAEPRRCCNEQPFRIYALLVRVGRVHLTSNQKIKNNNNHHQYIVLPLHPLNLFLNSMAYATRYARCSTNDNSRISFTMIAPAKRVS